MTNHLYSVQCKTKLATASIAIERMHSCIQLYSIYRRLFVNIFTEYFIESNFSEFVGAKSLIKEWNFERCQITCKLKNLSYYT